MSDPQPRHTPSTEAPADPAGDHGPGAIAPEQAERMTPEPASRRSEPAPARWRPQGFIERIGAALVAPRSALAEADRPGSAGTAGSDLAALLGLVLLATRAREIAFTLWVIASESVIGGLQSLAGVLSRAVATDLAVLFVAGFALTVAAGSRRAMGRDFDLVCVAFVPLVVVRLMAECLVVLSGITLDGPLHIAVAALAYGWVAVMVFLAWLAARTRGQDDAPPARAGATS